MPSSGPEATRIESHAANQNAQAGTNKRVGVRTPVLGQSEANPHPPQTAMMSTPHPSHSTVSEGEPLWGEVEQFIEPSGLSTDPVRAQNEPLQPPRFGTPGIATPPSISPPPNSSQTPPVQMRMDPTLSSVTQTTSPQRSLRNYRCTAHDSSQPATHQANLISPPADQH